MFYLFWQYAVASYSCLPPTSLTNVTMMSRVNIRIASSSQRGWLEMNFYRLHVIYFLLTIIISSIIIYGSGINGNSGDAEATFKLRYIDAVFLCASAMCNTGLNTVNLHNLTGFQQSILYVLIIIGNVTVTTNATIWIRRYFLRKHMKEFLKHSKAAREMVDEVDTERGRIGSLANRATHMVSSSIRQLPQASTLQKVRSRTCRSHESHHEIGHGGLPYPWEWKISKRIGSKFTAPASLIKEKLHHYVSFQPSFDEKVRPSTSVYRRNLTAR